MKKLSEQEWREFQERVDYASLWEKTHGANHFTITFNVWKHADSSVSIQKESGGGFIYGVPTIHNQMSPKDVWWKWDKEEEFRKLKKQLFISNNEWKAFCFKMYYLKPFTDREWEIFNYLITSRRSELRLGVNASPLNLLHYFNPTKDHFIPIIKSLKEREKKEKKIHEEKDHLRIVIGLLLAMALLIILIFRLYFYFFYQG